MKTGPSPGNQEEPEEWACEWEMGQWDGVRTACVAEDSGEGHVQETDTWDGQRTADTADMRVRDDASAAPVCQDILSRVVCATLTYTQCAPL